MLQVYYSIQKRSEPQIFPASVAAIVFEGSSQGTEICHKKP